MGHLGSNLLFTNRAIQGSDSNAQEIPFGSVGACAFHHCLRKDGKQCLHSTLGAPSLLTILPPLLATLLGRPKHFKIRSTEWEVVDRQVDREADTLSPTAGGEGLYSIWARPAFSPPYCMYYGLRFLSPDVSSPMSLLGSKELLSIVLSGNEFVLIMEWETSACGFHFWW